MRAWRGNGCRHEEDGSERSKASYRTGCGEVKRRTCLELVGLYSQCSYVCWRSEQGRWKGKSGRMKSESSGIHYVDDEKGSNGVFIMKSGDAFLPAVC